MRTLYLIRHGEVEKKFQKKFRGGKADCELSRKGVIQAKEIAQFIKELQIDVLVTTGLKRTNFVGQFFDNEGSLRKIIIPDLREIDFGLWDGFNIEDIKNKFPEELKNYFEYWEKGEIEKISFPNGENYQCFLKRVKKSLDELKNESWQKMAIVGHSFTNACLISLINNQRFADFVPMKYGEIREIYI